MSIDPRDFQKAELRPGDPGYRRAAQRFREGMRVVIPKGTTVSELHRGTWETEETEVVRVTRFAGSETAPTIYWNDKLNPRVHICCPESSARALELWLHRPGDGSKVNLGKARRAWTEEAGVVFSGLAHLEKVVLLGEDNTEIDVALYDVIDEKFMLEPRGHTVAGPRSKEDALTIVRERIRIAKEGLEVHRVLLRRIDPDASED